MLTPPAMAWRGLTYVLALVVQMGSPLVVLPFLTRTVGPAEFGRIAMAMAFAQLLALVVTLGLPGALTRRYFLEPNGAAVAAQLSRAVVAVGALLALAAAALMAILATVTSSRFVATLGIACVAAWGLACLTATQAFLRSAGRARAFLAVTAVAAIGSQTSGLLAVFIWRTDLAFLAGWAFGQLVMVAVAWSVCRAPGTVGPLMAELRPALQVALPTLPHSFALVAIVYTDRLVLGATVSAEAAGRYQLAYVVGASGLAMIGALNNLWAPGYYAQPEERRDDFLRRSTDHMLGIAVLLSVVIAVFGGLALSFIAPPEYQVNRELVLATSLLGVVGVIQVLYLSHAHILFWSGRTRFLLALTPAVAVAHIAANVALDRHLLLLGPPAIAIWSYSLLTLGLRWRTKKIRRDGLVHPSRLLVPAGALCVAVTTTLLLT